MLLFGKKYNIKTGIISVVFCLLFAFLCFVIQTSVFPLLSLFNNSPNLLLIITFSYGLLYGEFPGLFTGFLCGLIYDMYLNGIFGIYIFIYCILGYTNGLLYKSFESDTITTPIILCIVNTLIYNIYIYFTHFFVRGRLNLFICFYDIIIPNVIFTLIFSIVLYRFLFYIKKIIDNL